MQDKKKDKKKLIKSIFLTKEATEIYIKELDGTKKDSNLFVQYFQLCLKQENIESSKQWLKRTGQSRNLK